MPINSKNQIRRRDDVPWRELDQEGILLSLKDGDYFSVSDVSLFIWRSLDGKKNVLKIAEKITHHYEVSLSQAISDLVEFLTKLHQLELVTIVS